VRVAVVAETFLPQVNGVANSVRHIVDRLTTRGYETLVIAPGPGPDHYRGVPVVRARSMPLPLYRELPLGLPDAAVRRAIEDFRPDLVHLASPLVLGMSGLRAAERCGAPTVAVYQTDVVGFAQQYGLSGVERTLWAWTRRLYGRADRTLAPSRSAIDQLTEAGVPRIHRWGRGVDLGLFHPARRDPGLRDGLSPDGRVLVGYVGRVATEKRVQLLTHLSDLPGVQLVVVGDGPAVDDLRKAAPRARFLGLLHGTELARAMASLDVFVHTGAHETFCQTVQEAMASGVPVVAPAAGGPLDLVDPGHTGLLFPPDDPAAMRACVAALVGDPVLREAMSRAARVAVLERSWERVVDELIDTHYRPLLRRTVRTDATTVVA